MLLRLSKIIYMLLTIGAILLPTQAMFVYVFHLPNVAQVIYPFVIVGVIICFFMPLKFILRQLDIPFICLFILFLFSILISMIVNWDSIVATGMDFTYFCNVYSTFWDRPDMRLINWSIIRPFVFFTYILLLFIFIKYKQGAKVLIKYLIILALISCTYSIYQIFAAKLGLPYGSIFSGQAGREVIFFGLRRVEGVFYEAGPQATFLSPIFCILLSQLFEKNKIRLLYSKKICTIALGMVTFIMFLTISPIGFLTPFIALPVFLILNRNIIRFKLTKRIFSTIIKVVIGILLVIIPVTLSISKNATSNFSFFSYMINKLFISTTSIDSPIVYSNPDSRSVRNYVALKIFNEHKFVGVGQGGAISHFSKYSQFANIKKLPEQNGIINTHLKFLCELGLLGTLFYVLILAYPYIQYIKKIKFLKYYNKTLIDGLIIGYSIYLLISFQSTLQFWTPYFWMIYVLLVVHIQNAKNIYQCYSRRNGINECNY